MFKFQYYWGYYYSSALWAWHVKQHMEFNSEIVITVCLLTPLLVILFSWVTYTFTVDQIVFIETFRHSFIAHVSFCYFWYWFVQGLYKWIFKNVNQGYTVHYFCKNSCSVHSIRQVHYEKNENLVSLYFIIYDHAVFFLCDILFKMKIMHKYILLLTLNTT